MTLSSGTQYIKPKMYRLRHHSRYGGSTARQRSAQGLAQDDMSRSQSTVLVAPRLITKMHPCHHVRRRPQGLLARGGLPYRQPSLVVIVNSIQRYLVFE